ncbi:unnamed protein product [Moneuplotes crassus]|uniref:Uncharacterized protein n=1 Tax=Euplotes crassus TaxID=5936 RepID=A0AAD1U324_EUPCR|nr:unnamed protein product [Moneuplotes crassus]
MDKIFQSFQQGLLPEESISEQTEEEKQVTSIPDTKDQNLSPRISENNIRVFLNLKRNVEKPERTKDKIITKKLANSSVLNGATIEEENIKNVTKIPYFQMKLGILESHANSTFIAGVLNSGTVNEYSSGARNSRINKKPLSKNRNSKLLQAKMFFPNKCPIIKTSKRSGMKVMSGLYQ